MLKITANINVKIKFGESTGIVGRTGEGKSMTFIIINGLLEPHVKVEYNQ